MTTQSVSRASLGLAIPYDPPAPGSAEEAICGAFATALRIDQVGVRDDFFDLGGDSLAAEELSLLVAQSLGKSLAASVLAEYSSPLELVAHLMHGDEPRAPATAPTVFAVHGQQGYMMPTPDFFDGCEPGQRFHFFELPGLRDNAAPLETVAQLADHYLRDLLSQAPTGPIRLVSFCLGGVIAVQMAHRLHEAGRDHRLVMVEPSLGLQQGKVYLSGQWNAPGRRAFLDNAQRRRQSAEDWKIEFRPKLEAGRDPLRLRYPGQNFSLEARANFIAAANYHNPVRYGRDVLIFCSRDRRRSYDARPSLWDEIIPSRRTIEIAQTHEEVVRSASGRTARVLLDAFEGKLDA